MSLNNYSSGYSLITTTQEGSILIPLGLIINPRNSTILVLNIYFFRLINR
jgi:hypothetical protein